MHLRMVNEVQKIGMAQMNRKYFDASNQELAELIKGKTRIVNGNCLELNAGMGHLGLSLAELSTLEVYLLVSSEEKTKQACRYVEANGMTGRVRVLKGSLVKIPISEGMIDLVVSKSSVLFWQNRKTIFREIYRVLAPGGIACLCGDFEAWELKHRVETKLENCNPMLRQQLGNFNWQQRITDLELVLHRAEINSFEINYSDNGLWILIRKPVGMKVCQGDGSCDTRRVSGESSP
jgi:SAM-dependent methyltransferase